MSTADVCWETITPYILANLDVVDRTKFENVDHYVHAVVFYVSLMYPSVLVAKKDSTVETIAQDESSPVQQEDGESLSVIFEDFELLNIALRLGGFGVSCLTATRLQECLVGLVTVSEKKQAVEVGFWGTIKIENTDSHSFIARVVDKSGEPSFYCKNELGDSSAWIELTQGDVLATVTQVSEGAAVECIDLSAVNVQTSWKATSGDEFTLEEKSGIVFIKMINWPGAVTVWYQNKARSFYFGSLIIPQDKEITYC